MNPEIAKVIATFMSRVDLKGSEVPAYNACMMELNKFLPQDQVAEVKPEEEEQEAA